MGYTLYPPEVASDAVIRTMIAMAPLPLLTIVARRMGRGWLVSSLPLVAVALAAVVYAAPALSLFAVNGLRGTLLLYAHLVEKVAPFVTILSLAVLAMRGARQASNPSETA